jgi:hypothetical protein
MLSIETLIAEDYQETFEGNVEDHIAPSMHVLEGARAMHHAADHLEIDPDFAPWTQN